MVAGSLQTRDDRLGQMALATALSAGVLLFCVATLLLMRQFFGAMAAGLDSGVILGAVVVLLTLVSGLHWAGWKLAVERRTRWLPLVLYVLPALALFMFGMTLSFKATQAWVVSLAWLAILAEEGIWWTILLRGARSELRTRTATARTIGPSSLTVDSAAPVDRADEHGELLPRNVVQQFTRIREAGGEESLHGILRGTFSPGERTQNLHLAFCPPLASPPELCFEQVDGPPATIKAGQVETFGARLEIRLDSATLEPADVLLEFSALPHNPKS